MISTRRWRAWRSSNCRERLIQLPGCRQELRRRRLRQLAPADLARSIHQEFCRASYIAAVLTAFRKQQIIVPDSFRVTIGEQWKCETGLAGQFARFLRGVRTDSNRLNS